MHVAACHVDTTPDVTGRVARTRRSAFGYGPRSELGDGLLDRRRAELGQLAPGPLDIARRRVAPLGDGQVLRVPRLLGAGTDQRAQVPHAPRTARPVRPASSRSASGTSCIGTLLRAEPTAGDAHVVGHLVEVEESYQPPSGRVSRPTVVSDGMPGTSRSYMETWEPRCGSTGSSAVEVVRVLADVRQALLQHGVGRQSPARGRPRPTRRSGPGSSRREPATQRLTATGARAAVIP